MQHGSCECSKTELDLQYVPPTMTSMMESQWRDFHPIASLDSYTAPIEFLVPPHSENFTDLSQSYLYVKFRVLRANGENLEDDKNVSTANNFLHSMFSSIDMYLNNKPVSHNMDTYPYRAYLENLFSYGNEIKKSQLRAELWNKDKTKKFNAYDEGGMSERKEIIKESKPVEMQGKLHLDLCLQEKYLPNGIEIKIKLNRASPLFCLMVGEGGGGYPVVLKIDEAKLSMRQVRLLPALANATNRSIEAHNAKYPIKRVEVKTFTINQNLMSKIEDNLFQGQLPKRLFIGMVTNKAFNGDLKENPFNFDHFNLSKLEVTADGHDIYGRPFEPDFEHHLYLKSYLSMYQALGNLTLLQNCNIKYDEYPKGFCLWGFDFTPDQGADQSHLHPIKTGKLRIEVQFSQALEEAINVIVYAEYDNQIQINKLREVFTDF